MRVGSIVPEHPRWYTSPAVEQFPIEAEVFGAMPGHTLPEAARMVHVQGMHELMDQQIAHHRRALKNEAACQTALSPGRASSPSPPPSWQSHRLFCRSLCSWASAPTPPPE